MQIKNSNILNRLLYIYVLFLFSGVVSCQNMRGSADGALTHLEGVVEDSTGISLSNIFVEWNGQRAETDQYGRFSFESVHTGHDKNNLIVKLHGPEGTGQYRINSRDLKELAVFEYPVITEIILLHDNDLHFNYNHRNQFESRVKEIRAQNDNVWLMNAGDTFVRHADRWAVSDTAYYAENSRLIIETMNEVGYDVSSPGNHEMDYVGNFTDESLRLAEFPFVNANTDIATIKLPQHKPFTVFETTNGLSIAILGHSTGNYSEKGAISRNPVETTQQYLNLDRENDLFVALTHIGLTQDKALAEGVPELDVIIGGHSHTFLEEAIYVNGVLIAHAGGPPARHQVDPEWPKYLGIVKLVLMNGEVIEKSGRVITFDSSTE
ncbi:MAG: metallophosphoesterase [Balneolales bacterium]